MVVTVFHWVTCRLLLARAGYLRDWSPNTVGEGTVASQLLIHSLDLSHMQTIIEVKYTVAYVETNYFG